MQSSFGGMLGMFGGEAALEPLREPFTKKLQASIISISSSDAFQDVVNEALKSEDLSEDIYNKLSLIVNARLEELTPAMVKEIVQDMIKEHLGWLVIWGAVFGGVIGFVSTVILSWASPDSDGRSVDIQSSLLMTVQLILLETIVDLLSPSPSK